MRPTTPQARLQAVAQLGWLLAPLEHEELRIREHRLEVCQVDPRERYDVSAVDDGLYRNAHPRMSALQHECVQKGEELGRAWAQLVGIHRLRKRRRRLPVWLARRKGGAEERLDRPPLLRLHRHRRAGVAAVWRLWVAAGLQTSHRSVTPVRKWGVEVHCIRWRHSPAEDRWTAEFPDRQTARDGTLLPYQLLDDSYQFHDRLLVRRACSGRLSAGGSHHGDHCRGCRDG